jgi:hypothetical protein
LKADSNSLSIGCSCKSKLSRIEKSRPKIFVIVSSAATQKAHPVYSCILFSLTLQEGIALANDSRVGLASYFFSQDVSQERNYIKLSQDLSKNLFKNLFKDYQLVKYAKLQ